MSNTMYYDSKNDWYLVECKKVLVKLNHCYYDCIYSNGIDEINLSQFIDKDIPTIISYSRMQRIILNDKRMELPEYFV
jgi:hypothetical protein